MKALRRILALLFSCAFMLSLLHTHTSNAWSGSNWNGRSGAPKNILALGDAITAGYGLGAPSQRYADLIKQAFEWETGDPDAIVYDNLATIDMSAEELNEYLTVQANKDRLAMADLLVFSVGMTELTTLLYSILLSADIVVDNIPTALNSLRGLDANRAHEIFTSVEVQELIRTSVNAFNVSLQNLMRTIHSITSESGWIEVFYVDLYNPFAGVEEYNNINPYIGDIISQMTYFPGYLLPSYNYVLMDICSEFVLDTEGFVDIERGSFLPTAAGHAKIAAIVKECYAQLGGVGSFVDTSETKQITMDYLPEQALVPTYVLDIIWGSLSFTYHAGTQGAWDPESHTHAPAFGAGWVCEDGADKITVVNHSDANVGVSFEYRQTDTTYNPFNVTFSANNEVLASAVGKPVAEAASVTTTVILPVIAPLPSGDFDNLAIGNVTVKFNYSPSEG